MQVACLRMKTTLKYLFPCTGRSGSKYISELMKSCNVHCGHESVYATANMVVDDKPTDIWKLVKDPELECKNYEAESSFVLAPFLNDPPCREATVCHIVRHPLHVIDSWRHQGHFGSFPFMSHYCPFFCDQADIVSFCAGMYVAWNRFIEAQNWLTGRRWHQGQVEKAVAPGGLLDCLGLSLVTAPPDVKTNSIGSKHITRVRDIKDKYIRLALVNMADEYGYEL